MSPNGWGLWMDVHSVHGREFDGVVQYTVNGVNYAVDDVQASPYSPLRPRTVYYLSSQPSNGWLHNTLNETLDWGFTAGPGVVGAIFVATGFAQRARCRKAAELRDSPESFGDGIPSDTIKAIVQRNKLTGG